MKDEYKKLGEIATYINGYAFKPEDRGNIGLPIIRIQDLTGNAYDLGYYKGEYPKKIEINNGDVLISWSASLGVYVWNKGKALLNQHIFKVVFDKTEIDKDYFVYAVRYKLQEMASKTHGATMKHIIKKDFDNTLIPFPPLCKQNAIADILGRVERLIKIRNDELASLDKLIKARFVEMFGDPTINPKNWQRKRIDEIAENLDSKRKPITAADRINGPYPYYGASGIVDWVNDYIFDEDILLISEDGANLVMRSTPIAFSAKGKIWVNNHAHVLRFNNIHMQKFVEVLFSLIDISENITGTAQPKLNQEKLNSMLIIVPQEESLVQYYYSLEQIDKSKVAVQKSLEQTQLLFDSLMQEYFG